MTALEMGKPLRVAFGEMIAELGAENEKIVVLDGDTGSSTRTDIFEAEHPDRFFQMGITEQNMVGMAAGMATVGLIPTIWKGLRYSTSIRNFSEKKWSV